jgi:hypothetical protein
VKSCIVLILLLVVASSAFTGAPGLVDGIERGAVLEDVRKQLIIHN